MSLLAITNYYNTDHPSETQILELEKNSQYSHSIVVIPNLRIIWQNIE